MTVDAQPLDPDVVGRLAGITTATLTTPQSWSSPVSTRAAIEQMPGGAIAVVDAMGVTDAGILGDILCARMGRRGVAVFPNDVIVADDDGAVVIPAALLESVIPAAAEQERFEAWIMDEVHAGKALPGLYPPDADNKARYEAAVRTRKTNGN